MKKFNYLATISQFSGCFWYCYNTAAQECHVQNSVLNSITVECFSFRKFVCSTKHWCKKQIVLRHFYWKKETKTVISCDNKLVWFSFDSTRRRKLANMFPKIENWQSCIEKSWSCWKLKLTCWFLEYSNSIAVLNGFSIGLFCDKSKHVECGIS